MYFAAGAQPGGEIWGALTYINAAGLTPTTINFGATAASGSYFYTGYAYYFLWIAIG
jgi:hypothetical protein